MGLQVWLPLNGSLNNLGLSNATITNNGATINTSGKIGSCYSFDGTDDYISITSDDLYQVFKGGTQHFTIAFWVYHNDSTRGVIFGDYGLTGAINFNIELRVNHGVRFYWNGTPDKQFSDTVTAQGWTHIAIIYDGSKVNLYKNGVLSSDVYTGVLANKNKTSGAFLLGRDSRTGATVFNGKLNDFRIYDTALSPREVKEISKGLVLHYPLAMPGQENLLQGDLNNVSQWSVGSGSTKVQTEEDGFNCIEVYSTRNTGMYVSRNITLQANTTYTYSFDIKSAIDRSFSFSSVGHYQVKNSSISGDAGLHQDTNRVFYPTTLRAGKWTHCSITFDTLSESQVFSAYIWYLGSSGESGCVFVKNVKLERGSIATPWIPNSADTLYSSLGLNDGIEYDVSGYGHNGIRNGAITHNSDTAKYNVCSVFNGSSTYIEADHLPAETKTISIWLKTAWSSSSGYRMAVHDKTSGLAIGWSNVQLITYIGSTNGGSGSRIDTSGHYIANQWNHIVVVKTGDTTRDVYINGQLMTPSSVNYWGGGHDKLNIGNRISNGSYSAYFNGQMSDFRAYTTALSADDILELYHTPISLSSNGTLLTQGEYVES